jgi:sulfopyruvate decarboxylase subunit beta
VTAPRIALRDAVAVVRSVRTADDIVITTMGAAREWMALGQTEPLDLVFVPSAMSHATSVGLGLALAQPRRRVIVCNGDGSMLMNLGSLVSITAAGATNLVVIVFDNGVYEVTGAQPTAGAPTRATNGASVDFPAIARASRFPLVRRVHDLDEWRRDARTLFDAPGPTFIVLDVAPVPGAPGPKSPGPASERGRAFMAALRSTHAPGTAIVDPEDAK